MCWMTIQTDDEGNAAAEAARAITRGERIAGGHSWGVAFPDGEGEVEIHRGVGEVPTFLARGLGESVDADIALGHTRYATRGTIAVENAHPFPVHDEDGRVVAALAHNGTWYDAPDTDRADSYYIARLMEAMVLGGHDVQEAFHIAGDITGETLTAVTADGEGLVHSGRFDITTLAGSVMSTGGTPIPTGEVRAI